MSTCKRRRSSRLLYCADRNLFAALIIPFGVLHFPNNSLNFAAATCQHWTANSASKLRNSSRVRVLPPLHSRSLSLSDDGPSSGLSFLDAPCSTVCATTIMFKFKFKHFETHSPEMFVPKTHHLLHTASGGKAESLKQRNHNSE